MNNVTKQDLRKFYKQRRQELFNQGDTTKISNEICHKLLISNIFKSSKNIMLFYPTGTELNPLGILDAKDNSKNFFLPRCTGSNILVCPYKAGDELVLGKFNIKEPATEAISDIKILDIIIVPALCADVNGNRLGYGKGFYDRFFATHNLRAKKIIILPDEMLIENIPADDYDKKCDIIITEKRTLELA